MIRFSPLPFVLLALVVLFSLQSRAEAQPFETGKILAVERHEPETLCCYSGTDTPLPSNVVEYDISVRLGDTTYVVRYQTATGYVPTTWVKDHLVDVRVDKHSIYLRTPTGEELRLPIVSRKRTREKLKGKLNIRSLEYSGLLRRHFG